jgi:8-oxo-dGTP pyrophosphatase MutT (NUDIX family)
MKKQVAKVLITNKDGEQLVLWRSNHPIFPNDPDLPGGTVEQDEDVVLAAVREVEEEAGIVLLPDTLELIYKGSEYSENNTTYYLYTAEMNSHQGVVISWEHADYQWVSQEDFVNIAKAAKDTYMRMVYEVVSIHQKQTL